MQMTMFRKCTTTGMNKNILKVMELSAKMLYDRHRSSFGASWTEKGEKIDKNASQEGFS